MECGRRGVHEGGRREGADQCNLVVVCVGDYYNTDLHLS